MRTLFSPPSGSLDPVSEHSWRHPCVLIDCYVIERYKNVLQARFVFKEKKQDGEEYHGKSLYGLVCGIQTYQKTQCGKNFHFFDDDLFSKLRSCLDAVMKERSAAGIGLMCKRAEVIRIDEENHMWASNILGDENGKQLVETLVYLFGLHFALHGGKEHRRL